MKKSLIAGLVALPFLLAFAISASAVSLPNGTAVSEIPLISRIAAFASLHDRLARWFKANPGWHASGDVQRMVMAVPLRKLMPSKAT
jgi:hypothetical protein